MATKKVPTLLAGKAAKALPAARRAASPAKPAKVAPVAVAAPAPVAPPVAAPIAAPAPVAVVHEGPRVALGVYLNRNRNTAIAIKNNETGVWYLTMLTGMITLEHCSVDKFNYDWRLPLLAYPLRRAVRLYSEAPQTRDERTQKVMRVLLRDL